MPDNEDNNLFYAVQSNNESLVHALIDAGVDVNKTDDEGKTALFYAVMNDSINVAKALVEKGADVNARDIYHRTPLFYAMTISQTLFEYLLGKNGNVHIRDNCKVSILSYFIEICTLTQPSRSLQTEMEKRLLLMKMKKNIKKSEVFETIINFVFCKFPHITFGNHSKRICEVLEISKNYIETEQHQKNEVINKITARLLKQEGSPDENLCISQVPDVLDLLLELGANPDSVDIEGNTALHYATRLPFWDVSENIIQDVFTKLAKLEETCNMRTINNHNNESPLLFGLSQDTWKIASQNNNWSKLSIFLNVVCKFLLKCRFDLTETTKRRQETAIHLILNLFSCLTKDGMKKEVTDVALELLKLILSKPPKGTSNAIMNRQDCFKNSPLHYWAQLKPSSDQDTGTWKNVADFKDLLGQLFVILRKNNAKLNQRNNDDETPLHVSKSRHALELLLKDGANPKDLDSCGRSPLIVAARNATLLKHGCHFYPDVSHDEISFWNTALSKGLDLWIVDKNGESIMSILIGYKDFARAKSLLKFAKEKGYLMSSEDPVATNLLNAICKDKSTHATQKIDLVECILECRSFSPIDVNNHLLECCTIISESLSSVEDYSIPTKKAKMIDSIEQEDAIKDIVHWEIAERLLLYGADVQNQAFSEIAKTCPALKRLWTLVADIKTIPLAIRNWRPVSLKHRNQLEKVARRRELVVIGSFWHHRDSLNKAGTFGKHVHVFVGLNIKDGREVAIKRAPNEPEHNHLEGEISTLVALAECKQVVNYFQVHDEGQFSYVLLELMEGNLEDYLKAEAFDRNMIIELLKDLLLGHKFMQSKSILHCSINPKNILFKVVDGNVCFKFANFSSSNRRQVDKFWIAPELSHGATNHSKKSEIFSLGRVLLYCLYILSKKSNKVDHTPNMVIDTISINDNFNTWENPPCPEATNLINQMIKSDPNERITAEDALDHPWLWPKTKKRNFLSVVGNQPEFKFSSAPSFRRSPVLNKIDTKFKDIIEYRKWDDLSPYLRVNMIKAKMQRKEYDTTSVAELLHFIRNVNMHVRDLPKDMQHWVLEENLFQESYPKLIMEVLQVIKDPNIEWHLRKELADVLSQE